MPASRAQQAATSERRKKLVAMRIAGLDFDTIAERLDYSSGNAASKDFCRALERNRVEEAETVEAWRDLEMQRLDRLQAAVWPKALKGDLKAVETARRLIAERWKILGVPQRTEITGPDGAAIRLEHATLAELSSLIAVVGDLGPDADEDNAGPPDGGDSEDPGDDSDADQG